MANCGPVQAVAIGHCHRQDPKLDGLLVWSSLVISMLPNVLKYNSDKHKLDMDLSYQVQIQTSPNSEEFGFQFMFGFLSITDTYG